ncbi:MAG: alanine racemase [candidate division Zixibacteria bacterium]|nr:alanine racemase [candidate division Zixibacteria bacterium]
MDTKNLLNWIELSPAALDKNLDSLSRLAAGRTIAVAVKSNAYGHGLAPMIDLLDRRPDVEYVSVHSLDEAIQCRKYGWSRRILLLGPAPLTDLEAIPEFDLEPVVFTSQALTRLGKLAAKSDRPIRTHVKLETGTHRQGITAKELEQFAAIYKKYPRLGKPYGVSMHFANIEDTTNHAYAQGQLDVFNTLIKRMAALGIKPTIRHTACSAALILFEKTRFEMVRPGIAVYGHWPSKETYLSYRLGGGVNDIFSPVLSWHTRVTQIKKVPRDSFVGYGCTYRTTAPTRLAVLPVGYADGYDRSLSSLAYVLIKGQRAPVRGRVCMNLMMVDITDIPGVRLEEPVTLIGRQGEESLSAEQVAAWAGTISYEILARLSPDISRLISHV